MKHDFFKDLQKELLEIQDRSPDLSLDSAFVAWFMRAFITEDEKQAVDSLTGKAGDKSADAIYVDHDNRIVFIVQGKYHQKNSFSEPRYSVLALSDLGRTVMSDRQEAFDAVLNKANPKVRELLVESRGLIHRRDYQLAVRYVTTGKVSQVNVDEATSRLEEFDTARFEAYAFKDLMKLMQDYVEGAAPPVPVILLRVQGSEVFNRTDTSPRITSWIFTMAGNEVGKLFKNFGVRLFARNIRGYLGNTEINKVMKKTIDAEPEYFWYYNNGVTIVCDKAEQKKTGGSNNIRVTNAQVINGQQTTRTLSLATNNDAEVLVKLVEIPREGESHQQRYRHLVTEIVSATNWQNAISQADLKSNDIEQVRIEKELKKLDYFYVRKKMSKSELTKYGADKYSFRIKKEQMARAVAACSLDPYEVRLGKDRLFEDDIYSKIFNGRKVADYLTQYWLMTYVEYWSKGNDKRVYAKWHGLNLLWLRLGNDLKKPYYRDQLRLMMERYYKYERGLNPLNLIIKETFRFTSSFYDLKKRIDGKVQTPRDFFKHANYHKLMYKALERSKHNAKLKKLRNVLIESIEAAAENR